MNEQEPNQSKPNESAQPDAKAQEAPKRPTVADRVAALQDEAKKKVFQKQQAQSAPKTHSLNELEKGFAVRMLPLLSNEAFKAWMEYTNLLIAENMRKIFQRPDPALFDSQNNNRGEWMAFNHGMIVGMTKVQQSHANLSMKHFNEEERKRKEGAQDGQN